MDEKVQNGEQAPKLNKRDVYFLKVICSGNVPFVVTPMNGHVAKIEPVGKPLTAAAIPEWWIEYYEANDIRSLLK